MKNSIANQLFTRGIIILLFILSVVIAGQVCISLLKRTSNKVFEEYVELDALQEYRTKLNHVLIHFDNFNINDNINTRSEFNASIQDCYTQLDVCNKVLTHRHDRTLLLFFKDGLLQLDSLKTVLFSEQQNPDEKSIIQKSVISIVKEGTQKSELLLRETKIEVDEFIQKNNTAVIHSTITIIMLGFILLLISTIGGLILIKKLTIPISTLLASTKKVRAGEFAVVGKINSNNEFNELADSFNSMIRTLEKTTISRNYYDNLLKNMIEPLIITDNSGLIKSVNKKALELLGYNATELLDNKVEKLFYSKHNWENQGTVFNELKHKAFSNSEKTFFTKDGYKIPVLISTSVINNNEGEVFRHIIVAHDLTEKINIERKLENERKEKSIAINDAHEEEKFRIAIDLHDGLGQILTATSYAFQNYFGDKRTTDTEYQNKVKTIQTQIDTAIRESKNIAHNLIPIALKDFGLIVAVKNLIEQANQSSDIVFKFETFNYTTRINSKMEKAIFRIFQETVNNINKHSKAKNANFQINKYDDAIVLSIEDDGIGFILNEKTEPNKLNGIGLLGMRERITAFNGTLTINTAPNKGTEILIEIPCNKNRL